jgi:hypothetical protein
MTSIKLAIGVLAIAIGSGAVILISHQNRNSGQSETVPMNPGVPIIHTEAWYVAHPNIAKQDEDRCGGDAASLPQAACQNVASAEEELLVQQLQTQATANSAPVNSPKAP